MDVIFGLVIVFITFGLAVFVHELGHFLAARVRGVGVEEFAIGMGPKVFGWTRNGTVYSLRWLPFGGFVRLHQMVREDAEDQEREEKLAAMAEEEEGKLADGQPAGRKSIGQMAHEDMQALYDKGLLTKLMVFGGGVFFNFLTAMAALALLYTVGFDVPKVPLAWVGDVSDIEAFASAGLREGDYIVAVEGKPVERLDEFSIAMMEAEEKGTAGDGVDIKVRREGEGEVALTIPALSDPAWKALEKDETRSIWESPPVIGGADPMSPAGKAGIKGGDLVTKINDQPITRWSELTKVVRASLDEPVILHIRREGVAEEVVVSVVPVGDPLNPGKGRIGIASAGSTETEHIQESLGSAVAASPMRALERVVSLAVLNYTMITRIVQRSGANGLKESLGGPIAIGKMTYERYKTGYRELLDWFINLNIILLIMNLLPIPVLDGGFIILSFIEAAARRPVSTRILNPIYTVFALFFVGLAIFISYNDFLKVYF